MDALGHLALTSWTLTFQRVSFLLGLIFFLSRHRKEMRVADSSLGDSGTLPQGYLADFCTGGKSRIVYIGITIFFE